MLRSLLVRGGGLVATVRSKVDGREMSSIAQEMLPPNIESWSGTEKDIKNLILFEDDDLLVCYKPPRMNTGEKLIDGQENTSTTVAKTDKKDLLQLVQYPLINSTFPCVLLGLNHFNSGIVVFAKNVSARKSILNQIAWNNLKRDYLCVVRGHYTSPRLLTNRITIKEHQNFSSESIVTQEEVDKSTFLLVLCYEPVSPPFKSVSSTSIETMLSVRQYTSYKSQIYKQFNWNGMVFRGNESFNGMHCWSVTLLHPTLKEKMRFTVPPPRGWSARYPAEGLSQYMAKSLEEFDGTVVYGPK
jgi:hypothetical protein